MNYNYKDKVIAFLDRLNADTKNNSVAYGHGTFECEFKGNKFDRVFVNTGAQRLSRYFIRRNDGAIFASANWYRPNTNRQFGTLDTINQFDWSGYEGVAHPDSDFVMKPTVGPYATAILREDI